MPINPYSQLSGSTIAKVPKFLRCLYDILHFEDQAILAWSHDGTCFQVRNVMRLENEVLPKYFKHGKFTSFQRQLNNFGFHKWTKTRANVCTFSHDALVRCHPSRLGEMIATSYTKGWKASSPSSSSSTVTAAPLTQVSGLKRQRDESHPTFTSETTTATKKTKQVCIKTIDVAQLFDGLATDSPLVLLDAVDVSDLLTLDWEHAAAVGGRGNARVDGDDDALLQLEPLSLSFDFECDGDDLATFDLDAFVDFGDEEVSAIISDELLLLDDVLSDADVSLLELHVEFKF